MNRNVFLDRLKSEGNAWDFIIIGGGATGLGIAVESASRGYRALLLEQGDFAQGTSSRSTKLVHGGVRYLKQGNISLVLEALRERGRLLSNAPHLVHNLSFVVPNYDWWEGPFYGIGMKLYDMLAGDLGLGPSRFLSKEQTIELIPTVEPTGLRGGVIYYDAQFDDARLAINLAQTAEDLGATLLNYIRVEELLKNEDLVNGVIARDTETDDEYELTALAVINATGVFCDSIRKLDDPECKSLIIPSQGIHLVLDKSFLPGKSAIMVPHTDDGRVLFAVPWHERIIVGTTDTRLENVSVEPRPLAEEIDFLLTHAARYLTKDPTAADVVSVFAGLRPLIASGDIVDTPVISRDHSLIISPSGLVTIAGGKWTTYRKMAEDTVNETAILAGLPERISATNNLHLHGWAQSTEIEASLQVYGSDSQNIKKLFSENPILGELLHPNLPYRKGEIIWAVREEMARTLADVLARRTRALLLDARASIDIAQEVAKLMAVELNKDEKWVLNQVNKYTELAKGYILD